MVVKLQRQSSDACIVPTGEASLCARIARTRSPAQFTRLVLARVARKACTVPSEDASRVARLLRRGFDGVGQIESCVRTDALAKNAARAGASSASSVVRPARPRAESGA